MAPDSSPTKSEPPTKDAAPDPTNAYSRLHITPLDQDLLKIVLPASVLPRARNISLHTLETFPEKRYGFVDLPLLDAEKLKKRLNGTTLKGTRMRVEKARAEERPEPLEGHASDADAKTSKKRKAADGQEPSKKRKRDVNVIQGVVLKDRKVKRGWTESTDTKVKNKRSKDKNQEKKRKRPRSKYTDQDECLLKTRLPPNAVGNLPAGEAYKKKKKGGRGNAREIIVHEFEKTTTFPGFLKNQVPDRQGKEAVDFVDGKGWVDEDGNLVEAVEVKARARANDGVTKAKPKKNKKPVEKKIEAQESSDDDSTSSSGTSSEEEDSDSDTSDSGAPEDIETLQKGGDAVSKKDQSDTSSGSSSDEDEDEDEAKEQTKPAGQEGSRPMSSSSSRSLTIQIPPPTTPGKVHPLEALYKRPKPDGAVAPAAPAESFSFFAAGAQDDDIEDEDTRAVAVPLTPFTRQDLEWRNVRSAAPTPDTAHPSRMRNFWAPDDDEEDGVHGDGEAEGEGKGNKETRPDGQQGTSDFQSWFWENRRDLNKSWMTRRKAAAKEKRHRENKSRASKAI